ncbi:MAG: hypothetical protein QXT90_03620, partial [Candidatus Caldarchaeum sp.]
LTGKLSRKNWRQYPTVCGACENLSHPGLASYLVAVSNALISSVKPGMLLSLISMTGVQVVGRESYERLLDLFHFERLKKETIVRYVVSC